MPITIIVIDDEPDATEDKANALRAWLDDCEANGTWHEAVNGMAIVLDEAEAEIESEWGL